MHQAGHITTMYFSPVQNQAEITARYLLDKGIGEVDTGIILGTGLHHLGSQIEADLTIPYSEIPGFCISTVESHKGNLIYGKLGEKPVIALQGRFHIYEGYTPEQITFPVRVMSTLGIRNLFISNAAGALNPAFKKGELMLISNHLDYQESDYESVTEMNSKSFQMYDPEMAELMKKVAIDNNIILHNGCYAAVTGPQLETRAEYRYLRKKGADAVGMSTVPEVKEACLAKMRCVAVSVLTDECDPDNLSPVTLEEIISVAGKADKILTSLFYETILKC